MREVTDTEIWNYAKAHGFVIVSKDSDFQARSLFYGHPPKFIWLRVGNCSVLGHTSDECSINNQVIVEGFQLVCLLAVLRCGCRCRTLYRIRILQVRIRDGDWRRCAHRDCRRSSQSGGEVKDVDRVKAGDAPLAVDYFD